MSSSQSQSEGQGARNSDGYNMCLLPLRQIPSEPGIYRRHVKLYYTYIYMYIYILLRILSTCLCLRASIARARAEFVTSKAMAGVACLNAGFHAIGNRLPPRSRKPGAGGLGCEPRMNGASWFGFERVWGWFRVGGLSESRAGSRLLACRNGWLAACQAASAFPPPCDEIGAEACLRRRAPRFRGLMGHAATGLPRSFEGT